MGTCTGTPERVEEAIRLTVHPSKISRSRVMEIPEAVDTRDQKTQQETEEETIVSTKSTNHCQHGVTNGDKNKMPILGL